jgi:hypothetical protein
MCLTVETKPRSKKGNVILNFTHLCCYDDCKQSGTYRAWFLDYENEAFLLCKEHRDDFIGIYESI